MKVFQRRYTQQQKESEIPNNPVDETDKTPTSEVLEVLSTPQPSISQNIETLPEPLEPSALWLEAIAQAQAADPARTYLVWVRIPETATHFKGELARLVEPNQLPQALQALALRHPTAASVGVYQPKTLEVLFAIGERLEWLPEVLR